MTAVWFVADLHLGHEKVSTLRGFGTTAHHDAAIVRQWNRQVGPGDIVHVLGDLSAGGRGAERYALEVLHQLPGRKRLVAGNHDSVASIHRTLSPNIPLFNEVFERIGDFGRVKIDGTYALMSHYPYTADHLDDLRFTQFRLRDEGMPLIHGHTHSDVRFAGREACVSWEAWGRLVGTGDLLPWIRGLASW